ncbi:MAG: type II secretion system F family protein [Egibacteraceae bacterium]
MSRTLVGSALLGWVGVTLLLSRLRWFARPSLVERLRPYTPGGMVPGGRRGILSLESFRDAVAPFSRAAGERVARLLGISEDLDVRLRRVHSDCDPTAFRVRQTGAALAGFGVGALLTLALPSPPVLIGLLLIAGCPLLAFLILEQQVAVASQRWQRRLQLELPVIAEQLAMLLSAGFSLGGALNRIAARGRGCCARDVARVCQRMRQGLPEERALREWAEIAQVPALDQLVPVLVLNREASDLGRLLSDEARAIRRDVQRRLVEAMERKAQQVWIPVTVAALIPGVILMAIPFITALRQFTG